MSYESDWTAEYPFTELPVFSLTDVEELHLVHSDPSIAFHPSSFPALEILTIERDTDISHPFSALLPDPSAFPSLKTLIFSNCVITEEFMGELTRFASNHKNTTREACTGR